MPTRAEVYAAIGSELDHIEAMPPERCKDGPRNKSVGDQLTTIRALLAEGEFFWLHSPGDDNAMEYIRKIAGAAAWAMHLHGAPMRGK